MDIHHQFSPALLTYPEPTEFDYSAFLNTGDDMAYHQAQAVPQPQLLMSTRPQLSPTMGHAPGLGSSLGPGYSDSSAGRATTPGSDTISNSTDLARKPQQKQRLERRGHTKSRRGCYNCKRRRIKVGHLAMMSLGG
jgi:hypothetical protein